MAGYHRFMAGYHRYMAGYDQYISTTSHIPMIISPALAIFRRLSLLLAIKHSTPT